MQNDRVPRIKLLQALLPSLIVVPHRPLEGCVVEDHLPHQVYIPTPSPLVGTTTFCSWTSQVKKPSTLSFLPLREALSKPEPFMETDFAKIGRPGVLHQAFRGLDKVGYRIP